MSSYEYDWSYLGSKPWFRLLNVVVGIGALVGLVMAIAASQGQPAYVGSFYNSEGTGGICFPSAYQTCYEYTVPATPFNWNTFWIVCGVCGFILWVVWAGVVYVLAGAKARRVSGPSSPPSTTRLAGGDSELESWEVIKNGRR